MSELKNWRPANSSDIGRCDVAYSDMEVDGDDRCEEILIEQQTEYIHEFAEAWTLERAGDTESDPYEDSHGCGWSYAFVPITPRDMSKNKAYQVTRVQSQRMIKSLHELSRLHLICCDLDKPESEWIESDCAFIPPFKNAVELLREIGVDAESTADSRRDRE